MRLSVNFTVELTKSGNGMLSRTSWRRLRRYIKQRDGETCQYCGKIAPNGQVDHAIPLTRGGTDTSDNLVWACPSCNAGKGNKTLQEWTKQELPAVDLPPVEIVQQQLGNGKIIEV